MTDARFPRPVRLHFKATADRLVASAWEAIECMRQQWPGHADRGSYRSAYRACRDAVDGWRTSVDAYRAFLKAAESAGLLVEKPRREPIETARAA